MIEESKILNFKNLLSFRSNLTQCELQNELKNIDKFLKENKLSITGPKISTTYSVKQSMDPVMDIEILIPIDNSFNETSKYKFKKELKLINTLKNDYIGNPQGFNNCVMEIQEYISQNSLIPISSLYTVTIHEIQNQNDIDNFHAELYIAINPNIF